MTTPMALDTGTRSDLIRRGDRLLAPMCLTVAEHLVRLKFGRLVAGVRHAKRTCRRPATTIEAGRITAAVHHAARHRAGRVACLEYSLAAMLVAILRRRSLDWCIGARLMPYASHAWVETDNRPVGEPDTRDRPYHVLLRV
jgi:hypothetical protein